MMAITSDADRARSPAVAGPNVRVGRTVGWPWCGVGVAPRAPARPPTLTPHDGCCPQTAAEALSAGDSSRNPPPSPRRIACESPPSRFGPALPLPRPLSRPPPRPRTRPRPAEGAIPRAVPIGATGACTAVLSARRATATAPRSTACAALTARVASSATRAASAVMASARFRARATWRRWLRVNSPGIGPRGSEASCSSMVTCHQDRGRQLFSTRTAHPAWRPLLNASGAPSMWGRSPRHGNSAITSVGNRHQIDKHPPVGLRAKFEQSSRPASRVPATYTASDWPQR